MKIKQTDLPNGFWVSTIGREHWNNRGKILFETLAFYGESMSEIDGVTNMHTIEEALAEHGRLVREFSKITIRKER
jgi:hypothetical protein